MTTNNTPIKRLTELAKVAEKEKNLLEYLIAARLIEVPEDEIIPLAKY